MKAQPAAFLRTTLPLDLTQLATMDDGRYHSVWLPDHMVSFSPDSIWTPEFTDLAVASPSPHRRLDGLAVAAAAAALTKTVPIATLRALEAAAFLSGADPALRQQLLHVAEAWREAEIQPPNVVDHIRRETVALVRN